MNLMNTTRGASMPLKVDPKTLRYNPYTRVSVDVDCSTDLLKKVLVKRKKATFGFFMGIYYEFVPYDYQNCKTIG